MENDQIEEPMYYDNEYTERDAQRDMDAREHANEEYTQEVHFHPETPEETARFEALDAQLTAAGEYHLQQAALARAARLKASAEAAQLSEALDTFALRRGMARIGNGLFVRTRRIA
jgi:hypothetical protein